MKRVIDKNGNVFEWDERYLEKLKEASDASDELYIKGERGVKAILQHRANINSNNISLELAAELRDLMSQLVYKNIRWR